MTGPGRHVAASERAALADALLRVGATSPTLCSGWTALDLAAHVVVRERRMDSLPGLRVAALAPWTDRLRSTAAARGLPALVEQLRSGPPPWSVFALPGVDARGNEVEMLIHHEDVRRGAGEEPRTTGDGLDAVDAAAWSAVTSVVTRMTFRGAGVGVELARTSRGVDPADGPTVGDPVVVARAPEGSPVVTVTGAPVELLLFASGRAGAARVALTGPAPAVAALNRHNRSM